MEMSENSMAVQESRNDSQGMLLHLEMYQPFNKYTAILIRAVTKLVNKLYFHCHTNGLPPGSTYAA